MRKVGVIHSNPYSSGKIAFDPRDGHTIANGGKGMGGIQFWDIHSGELKRKLPIQADTFQALAFSPDGSVFVSGGADTGIQFWDTHDWNSYRTITEPKGHILDLQFSPDGSLIAANSYKDGTVRLWDVQSAELIHTFEFGSFAFHPVESTIYIAHDDRFSICDIESGKLDRVIQVDETVEYFVFHPQGTLIAAQIDREMISLWHGKNMHIKRLLENPLDARRPIFSPDGKILAITYETTNSIILWNHETGEAIDKVEGDLGVPESLLFSPDGKVLVRGGWGLSRGYIEIWQV
ncbi:MAG TPA: hypothetical protein VHO84_00980 [Syntrophorhabdaceae bacterium]|nr:hypothetical protein [Syntrophorhabdaceae bacterium]HEX3052874.1 hypothetical protein [Aggregatilineaceae bacterium]